MKSLQCLPLLGVWGILICSTHAWAQYGSDPYAGVDRVPRPTQAAARIDAAGVLEIINVTATPVMETRQGVREVTVYQEETRQKVEKQIRDGVEVEVPVQYTVKVPRVEKQTFTFAVTKLVRNQTTLRFAPAEGGYVREQDQAPVKFYETNGDLADSSALADRLESWTLVLLTHNGKMPEEYYAWCFKPGTLIIALPEPLQTPPEVPRPIVEGVSPPQPQPADQPAVAAIDSNTAPAAPNVQAPAPLEHSGIPPALYFASQENDSIRLRTITDFSTPQFGLVQSADAQGREVFQPIQMERVVRTHTIVVVPRQHVRGFTTQGELLSDDALRARLEQESTVLISQDGKPVADFWLQNLRPGMIVLVPPAQTVFKGASPYAAPMPNAPAS